MEQCDYNEDTESKDSNLSDSKLEISNLESENNLLIAEKNTLKAEFGQQRAKLKELFIQKEEEVKLHSDKIASLLSENNKKTLLIQELQRERDDLRSQVTIAQCTAENGVEVERRKCTEEIASVTQILKEELSVNESQIDQFRKKINNLEIEKYHYRSLYEQKLEECEPKKEDSLLSPGLLSSVTKSFVKKVPNLNSSHSKSDIQDNISGSQIQDCNLSISSSPQQAESLEESMKKAQEDTSVLKSLVVPLEAEINALKVKIREQDVQLRVMETHDKLSLKTSDIIGPLLQNQPIEDLLKDLDMKLHEVRESSRGDKTMHADLEFYGAILNTQKTALSDQVEIQKEQLQEIRKMYNEERKQHSDLRIFSQKINSKYIDAQRINLYRIRKIKSFLTIDQLTKMQDVMESNIDEQIFHQSSDNSIYNEIVSENSGSNIDSNNSTLSIQTDKLPQLTDDQKRALSGAEKCSQQKLIELEPSVSSSPQVLVNEVDWLLLQEEINKYQKLISKECKMCTELESNLKKTETDLKEGNKKKSTAEKAIGRMQIELERESSYRKKVGLNWRQMAEDFERKSATLQLKIDNAERNYNELIIASKRVFQRVHEQLKELTNERELVNKELIRLQTENDTLVGKHSIRSQELQNEIINLPDSMEDMQLLLLKYREDVIAAKVAKEHIEETLNSRLLFINDQLEAEQHERASLESKLVLEIEELRDKAAKSVNHEEELIRERQALVEAEEKVKVSEQKARDTLTRSQNFITALKNQIDEHENKKAQQETVISDLRTKVSSLQQDLKTSEAVQRDFVRLSQSLQVHLEKIRQSDKEVRWQHEDDVEDCNHCNQKFNAVGRRKHHCKHCGKIFCTECVTKTVISGPNRRPVRVCDVCHTLLVHDATPFFSSEPLTSPD